VIAAGQPVAGSTGQVLTKNSGTNYDSSWATPVVGDRYLTSSTTSNTIGNGNKTFTIGTGLSYTPTQSITIAYDAANHMHGEVLTYNSGTGVLTVDINHHTGAGTYAAWVVNVGGVVPATSVAFADITGAVSGNANLQAALDLKLDVTTAATTYYPLVGNPSAFLVAADITGKANLASPDFTGNVTITSSTGSALFITQTGTGNILTLHDQAADTNFVAIDANGKVNTIASEATNGAGFNVPHGVAPTTPLNGDIFTTTSGLFMRQNGVTRQYVDFDGTQTINGPKTFSNASNTFGSATATGTIGLASGATISASTKTVNVATGGVVGSTTLTTIGPVLGASTTSIGGTTAASTLNLATGATLTATTKAVNIGTAGVAGSTTNIAIGSTTGTSTTTLQGTTNGITAAADTNSVALATTAYVVGQASSTAPAATGTAAVGTSLKYARADHVHVNPLPVGGTTSQVLSKVDGTNYNVAWTTVASGGGVWGAITGTLSSQTDLQSALDAKLSTATAATTYAPLASPSLTGTPLSTTAATSTNTTQIATTAFVVGQAGTASPLVNNGTAVVGTSLLYSRQDHVHPTDTTRAPLASPSLTGTPLSTTAAVDTNTTQIATTAFVVAQAASATPLVNGTAAVGTSLRYARADHVHGTDTTRAPLASPTFTGTVTIPVGASISGFAPLASPSLTGTPLSTTATALTNTTQIATTAFVRADNNVKAWVNFNGTGTVAIRGSFNVSSITDNGTGDYTVNFTTALADVNYAVNGVIGDGAVTNDAIYALKLRTPNTAQLAGSIRVGTNYAAIGPAFASADFSHIGVTIIR
jgi:hypothetical protein